MEQQHQCHHNKVCLEQDMCDSLSFSGLLCITQQIKSLETHTAVENNGYGISTMDSEVPDFKFSSSSKHQLINPVSYNNLSVLLPHFESSGAGRETSSNRFGGREGKKDIKGIKRVDVKKKKGILKSIFEPCRVCHAVEPSAIREQINPTAARKQNSF